MTEQKEEEGSNEKGRDMGGQGRSCQVRGQGRSGEGYGVMAYLHHLLPGVEEQVC